MRGDGLGAVAQPLEGRRHHSAKQGRVAAAQAERRLGHEQLGARGEHAPRRLGGGLGSTNQPVDSARPDVR